MQVDRPGNCTVRSEQIPAASFWKCPTPASRLNKEWYSRKYGYYDPAMHIPVTPGTMTCRAIPVPCNRMLLRDISVIRSVSVPVSGPTPARETTSWSKCSSYSQLLLPSYCCIWQSSMVTTVSGDHWKSAPAAKARSTGLPTSIAGRLEPLADA